MYVNLGVAEGCTFDRRRVCRPGALAGSHSHLAELLAEGDGESARRSLNFPERNSPNGWKEHQQNASER